MPKATSSSYSKRIRLSSIKLYCYIVALILLLGEVMPFLCSCCDHKGLECIILASPLLRQPSSYFGYTKANIRLSYNIYNISNAKYTRYIIILTLLDPYLIYYRVLDLI